MAYRQLVRGVRILGAGRNGVRFAPPLILTNDQADTAGAILDQAWTACQPR